MAGVARGSIQRHIQRDTGRRCEGGRREPGFGHRLVGAGVHQCEYAVCVPHREGALQRRRQEQSHLHGLRCRDAQPGRQCSGHPATVARMSRPPMAYVDDQVTSVGHGLTVPRRVHPCREGPASCQNGQVSDLIDTTEMYLRTIYELVEEGVVPLRARIAERLHQSGPTVSQTVGRMERDGLVTVHGDRHLEFTPHGLTMATRVMRKHRLAERLLVDVIGLDWEVVHEEACRWEHVMSETVERRLVELLGEPTESPYGNPIPGLAELGHETGDESSVPLVSLSNVVTDQGRVRVLIRRISEELQKDETLMRALRRAGAVPGAVVQAWRVEAGIALGSVGEIAEVSLESAEHLYVNRP